MKSWRNAVASTCGAGGAVWCAHALLLASRAEGCIGATCAWRSHRPSEDVAWLFLVAVVLIAVGSAVFAARAPAHGRRLLWCGVGLVTAGAVLLLFGVVVNATVSESPLWWLHDSDTLGRFLPVLGGALMALGLLRGAMLRPWVGVALLVGAVLSSGFNVQNVRILLALPMGLAWVVFGYAAWRSRSGDNRTAALLPATPED